MSEKRWKGAVTNPGAKRGRTLTARHIGVVPYAAGGAENRGHASSRWTDSSLPWDSIITSDCAWSHSGTRATWYA